MGSRSWWGNRGHFSIFCIWGTSLNFFCGFRFWWYLSCTHRTRNFRRIFSILWLCMER
uniref:ORF57f n=1 Tax=Pinus koraiensis TaxID=88728 RepID=A4QMA0_PINKO|nr:ORF57f [Pinus koraiensis]ABP35437.1 ORF57f [Pinus koraiensis]